MNLVIDIGNSAAKAAVFDGYQLIDVYRFDRQAFHTLRTFTAVHSPAKVIVSNVGNPISPEEKKILNEWQTLYLTEDLNVPLKNNYLTKETLGNDRLATMVGAGVLYPGQNVLVIDAGTCITCDLLESGDQYSGGSISPGIKMRLDALHSYTGNLPLVEPEPYPDYIGRDTKTSMLAGVMGGILLEIDGIITAYKSSVNDLKVIATGGDHKFFVDNLKNEIFAIPNLVLIGLNKILDYNAK